MQSLSRKVKVDRLCHVKYMSMCDGFPAVKQMDSFLAAVRPGLAARCQLLWCELQKRLRNAFSSLCLPSSG